MLFLVRDGKVALIVPVSTGATGNTPPGHWRVQHGVPGSNALAMYLSPRSSSAPSRSTATTAVPPHPAELHGCVRIPLWVAYRVYPVDRLRHSRSTSTGSAVIAAALALAGAGWLLYTAGVTGKTEPVPYTDLTPQLGTIEFTRKVTGGLPLSPASLRKAPRSRPCPAGRRGFRRDNWDRDQVAAADRPRPLPRRATSLRVLRVVERRWRHLTSTCASRRPRAAEPVTARVTYPYQAC